MIAPHLRESAGHLQAQIDTLNAAIAERDKIIGEHEAAIAPIKQSRDELQRRVDDLQKAMQALRDASGAPTLWQRLTGVFREEAIEPPQPVPGIGNLPTAPPAPESQPGNPPGFTEIAGDAATADRPMSEREKALAARGE